MLIIWTSRITVAAVIGVLLPGCGITDQVVQERPRYAKIISVDAAHVTDTNVDVQLSVRRHDKSEGRSYLLRIPRNLLDDDKALAASQRHFFVELHDAQSEAQLEVSLHQRKPAIDNWRRYAHRIDAVYVRRPSASLLSVRQPQPSRGTSIPIQHFEVDDLRQLEQLAVLQREDIVVASVTYLSAKRLYPPLDGHPALAVFARRETGNAVGILICDFYEGRTRDKAWFLLVPFTVVADVATFPIQILFMLAVGHAI